MLYRIIRWAVVIIIAFYLVTQPAGADHAVTHLLNALSDARNSLATFVHSL